MHIQINDKKIPKRELIALIKYSKLKAIVHIRSIGEIGLKDAKEIIDNLDEDADYYDSMVIEKENITLTKHGKRPFNKRERDAQVLKVDNINKKIIIFLLFVFLVVYLATRWM